MWGVAHGPSKLGTMDAAVGARQKQLASEEAADAARYAAGPPARCFDQGDVNVLGQDVTERVAKGHAAAAEPNLRSQTELQRPE
jgi:hypothetical protein